MEKKNIIIIALIIIILGGVGYYEYRAIKGVSEDNKEVSNTENNNQKINDVADDTNQNTSEEQESNEIDYSTKLNIRKIIGLPEEGLDGCSNTNTNIFLNLEVDKEIIINDLDTETKKMIIFKYASFNHLLTRVSGNEYNFCAAGSGECLAITKENYDYIRSKYGITDSGEKLFVNEHIYNDKYLFIYGGSGCSDKTTVDDSIEYNRLSEDTISVNYKITSQNSGEYEQEKQMNYKREIDYTFKKDKNNEYYLEKLIVKNV